MKLPKGFSVSSMHAGIKKKGYDLGLIMCASGAQAVGVFTRNVNSSYSIRVSKKHINNLIHGVLVNSGNANCFTKKKDVKYTENLCKTVAQKLKVKTSNVLIASTGIISRSMPFTLIEKKIPALCGKPDNNFALFAQSIRTTDTFSKISTKTVSGKNGPVRIVGCAKGAGMIQPDMATMLAFVLIDADTPRAVLKKIAKNAVEKSFNSISVDGCMSTNDCVFFLSSGKLPVDIKQLEGAVEDVCIDLAKMIVCDGEGATKTARIVISGARSQMQAKKALRAISSSVLFRSALFGENANWGRIVAALGAEKITLDENKFKVTASPLEKRDITINVHLGQGTCSWQGWCSDITPRYVHINAGYS